MLNTIIIVISVSLVLGGAVLTWWFENGPEKKEKPENESDGKAGNHSQIYGADYAHAYKSRICQKL